MENLVVDLRHCLRTLIKNPGFLLVAVSALAIGIGANTAIFSVVQAVLLEPLPYPEPERLVLVGREFRGEYVDSVSIPKFSVWLEQNQVLDFLSAHDFAGPGVSLSGGDLPEQVQAVHVSLDYFRLFGAGPQLGRTFLAEEDRAGGPRVAVMSHALWARRFGADRGIIGQSVTLGGERHTVVGVMAPDFRPQPLAEIWLPLQADRQSANHAHYLIVAGRLKPGVTLEQAHGQMQLAGQAFRRLNPEWMSEEEGVSVVPMQQQMVGDVRPALLVLLGSVGFVLLVACANVANLLLARGVGRRKEIAIRSALGARRTRLVRQLLLESGVLALLGALAGIALANWGLRALLAFSPGNIPRLDQLQTALHLNPSVLAYTTLVACITVLLFGLAPALQLSRPNLNAMLKETGGRGTPGVRQRRAHGLLVSAEIALTLVLLIGAALLVRTFVGLRSVDPGIDPRNVLTLKASLTGERYNTNAAVSRLVRQGVERLEALPGIVAVSPAVDLPAVNTGIDLPMTIEGLPLKDGEPYHGDEYWRYVDAHYFRALEIPLRRGRVFDERDALGTTPVALINEAMARKYWPQGDPIRGRIVIGKGLGPQFEDPPREIVGIVADVREAGLSRPAQPVVYVPVSQLSDNLIQFANQVIPMAWLVRTAGSPHSFQRSIREAFFALDNQLAVADFRTMEEALGNTTARQSFNMILLSVFAGMALLLAAIGLYGIIAYHVEQRTPEIGLRMALGADQRDTLRLILRQGMGLAGVGIAVGLAAAYGLTRLLSSMLFGVTPTDPIVFLGVAALLAAVAATATYLPARRATRVDPIVALRND